MGKIQEAVKNNAIQKGSGPRTMQDYIKNMEKEIAKALPSVLTPERFTRITLSALSSTPKLAETTPRSFLAAMMMAAQLGLEPNTPLGEAYLIPYKNKGVLECQFQIGYKGLIALADRSGVYVDANPVYEQDVFEYEFGLEPVLKHKPALKDRGEVICFYGIFKTKNGGNGFKVMSVEDVRNHAKKYSQSYESSYSPWKKNFEEMALKTVLKKTLKYAPLSPEFTRAVVQDGTVKMDLSDDMGEVPSVIIDAEGEVLESTEVVDEETGEVLPAKDGAEKEPAMFEDDGHV